MGVRYRNKETGKIYVLKSGCKMLVKGNKVSGVYYREQGKHETLTMEMSIFIVEFEAV